MLRLSIIIFFLISQFLCIAQPTSWKDTKARGEATLTCFWFDSEPFIYPTPNGPKGIEHDLLLEFKEFLKTAYGVRLTIDWVHINSFRQVLDTVKSSSNLNVVGASAFSITTDRLQDVKFSPPYIPDISVIVSDFDMPIAYNMTEFDSIFNNSTAVTIRQTTFEQQLSALQADRNLNFKIDYVPSSGDIITSIAERGNSFGYIDLPTYLSALQKTVNVKRQYLFSFKNQGVAYIMPSDSDWNIPFEAFFDQPDFSNVKNNIVSKYFGEDVPFLIRNIASGVDISSKDEVLLLTKEKEMQAQELVNSALKIQRENLINRGFLIGIAILLLIAGIIFNQYRIKARSNKLLNRQKVEIEQQNKQLVGLNMEKNNLINILAHDLKTPINNISGLVQLLNYKHKEVEQQQYIEQIQMATKRVSSMITKILDIESIESQVSSIKREPIDLQLIVKQALDEFTNPAEEKNIKLKSTFDDQQHMVLGDELYTLQVIENLVSNALKFSKKGTTVTVALVHANQKITCTVSDEGPGISKKDQGMLFNKFQRLSAKPTDGEQSTGLGLSIVKRFMELMGGRVWCESQMGHGATFFVEFDSV